MMTRKNVLIVGAYGRMGGRVIEALENHASLRAHAGLVQASEVSDDSLRARVPEGMVITDQPREALADTHVVIDFSAPPSCGVLAPLCAEGGIPYLIASTGLGDEEYAAIDAAAQKTAVILAANCSLGVNVLLELVQLAASRLTDFDIEISEIHHRFKRDAPSGTALALGTAAEQGRGELQPVIGRSGVSEPRKDEELGYGVLRGGDASGDHTVFFFGEGERIELTHRSTTADIFAAGAVRAAAWLLGCEPGRYEMRDVLTAAS